MVSSCTAPSRRSMAATPPFTTRAPLRPWALRRDPPGILQAQCVGRHAQLRRLATTLIASATMTAPKRYDINACDSAMRRTALVVRLVSET